MPKHAKSYTRTPACLVVRGIPIPRSGSVSTTVAEAGDYRWPESMALGTIVSGTVQGERAQRDAEALLRWCRERLRRGDRAALLELLDMNPAFITVRWVREELGRLVTGRLLARRRGRPRGRYVRHPLAVAGLVQYFLDEGLAANLEQAFRRFDDFGILPYDSAKREYYQARGDRRFRPILLEFPEHAEIVEAPDGAPPTAHVVTPGTEVTRTWQDPRLGTVRMTLRGE